MTIYLFYFLLATSFRKLYASDFSWGNESDDASISWGDDASISWGDDASISWGDDTSIDPNAETPTHWLKEATTENRQWRNPNDLKIQYDTLNYFKDDDLVEVGSRVEKYVIKEFVGRGAKGTCALAECDDGKNWLLKFYHAEKHASKHELKIIQHIAKNKNSISQFSPLPTEASIIYGNWVLEGPLQKVSCDTVLVQTYIPLKTLPEFMEKENSESKPNAEEIKSALDIALEQFHSMGMLHGDPSTTNMVIGRATSGELKVGLIDFDATIKLGYTPTRKNPECVQEIVDWHAKVDMFFTNTPTTRHPLTDLLLSAH